MDYSDFEKKLENLSGYDYDIAENEERMAGNIIPDIKMSTGFQARLAAKALGVPLDDIKKMRIDEYGTVTGVVSNFLFGSLAEMAKARLTNTGKSQ